MMTSHHNISVAYSVAVLLQCLQQMVELSLDLLMEGRQ